MISLAFILQAFKEISDFFKAPLISLKACRMLPIEVPYDLVFKIIALALMVYGIFWFMNKTPPYNRVGEGFFGGVARGSGYPDCLRTLPEASQILDILQSHKVNTIPAGISDANGDYNELVVLLSKMACLKKDLMSPGTQVDATRYQPFETAHDRVAVAELCGLCLNHNIASRDLDISISTWRSRGLLLLRRLCTTANLSDSEVKTTESLFKKAIDDVYSIAKSRCLKTDYPMQQVLGDVAAFESPNGKELQPYEQLYGGLSASGWNGVV